MKDDQGEVTQLILAWSQGDRKAMDQLMPLVEKELRNLARGFMRGERKDHTLQPTALVNELYLKLADQRRVTWKNRAHFMGGAAGIMRRLLVDAARRRRASKRGSGVQPVLLEELLDGAAMHDDELIALDDALMDLAKIDERQSRIVELRFFTGLSHREIAEALSIGERTVKRDWRVAKLWLHKQVHPDG